MKQCKLLIISPHFPPINAPDHQRIRISTPYFHEFGWTPHVLAVIPNEVEGVWDPMLLETLPDALPVRQVGALPIRYTRPLGVGNLGLRAFYQLYKAGCDWIEEEKFDLIYFSTTVFNVMALGPMWKKRYGVPFVLDMQDPWRDNQADVVDREPVRPGGWLKFTITQAIHRFLEPYVMRRTSHIISVSPAYRETLLKQYDFLQHEQMSVIPFGASQKDFEICRSQGISQDFFNPEDDCIHLAYVGRSSPDMACALRVLFAAVRAERGRSPQIWDRVRMHFIGTSYGSGDLAERTVEPVAREYDLLDIVSEHPHRIPYFQALKLLLDSDAVLIVSSDDPGYSASKLYPYVLAKKPIIAVMHGDSPVQG
ncbi:MAG: glycosyltransferase, partial [Magnetococcales bacterium]|nr:glycosyltransferase [Magnetococcales bacterium]